MGGILGWLSLELYVFLTLASLHHVSCLFRMRATPFLVLGCSGSSLFQILYLWWKRLFRLFMATSFRCDSCIVRMAIFWSLIIWFMCAHLSQVAADPPPWIFRVATFMTSFVFFTPKFPGWWVVSLIFGFAWSLWGGRTYGRVRKMGRGCRTFIASSIHRVVGLWDVARLQLWLIPWCVNWSALVSPRTVIRVATDRWINSSSSTRRAC